MEDKTNHVTSHLETLQNYELEQTQSIQRALCKRKHYNSPVKK